LSHRHRRRRRRRHRRLGCFGRRHPQTLLTNRCLLELNNSTLQTLHSTVTRTVHFPLHTGKARKRHEMIKLRLKDLRVKELLGCVCVCLFVCLSVCLPVSMYACMYVLLCYVMLCYAWLCVYVCCVCNVCYVCMFVM
jgi:hypothetical protein